MEPNKKKMKIFLVIFIVTMFIMTSFVSTYFLTGGKSYESKNIVYTATASNPIDPSYVPITLHNSQNVPTSSGFQQLLKINWSKYAIYLNANVSNVRFYNSNNFITANELYGWVQSNNTTKATSSNVWVNLANTIVPSDGLVTIYMAFLSQTASWDSYWGLAPQLSNIYGQFDNGAKVFTFYDNFAGTTLNTNYWIVTTLGSASYSVNDGLTLSQPGDFYSKIIVSTKNSYAPPFIFEASAVGYTSTGGGPGAYLGEGTTNSLTLNNSYDWFYNGWNDNLVTINSSGASSILFSNAPPYPNVFGTCWTSTGKEYFYVDGTLYTTLTNSNNTIGSSLYGIIKADYSHYVSTMTVQYALIRACPPASILPSVTFGSVVTGPTYIYLLIGVIVIVIAFAVLAVALLMRRRETKRVFSP